ncbi:IMP cyclohydrolase [Streptacidiphilus sp. EB103A]|uniref:IMP cyclohydrolase n=1 Tax=Streptacidiphilus sp. EB103A TaxID=3156275 RepID=UPI003515BBD5
MTELTALLTANPYPGRGVLCARTRSGAVLGGYFLTGRSIASKNRALRVEGDRLLVGPLAPSEHDPLRHYEAVLATRDWLVLGNGEQVSEVTERLRKGASPADLNPKFRVAAAVLDPVQGPASALRAG